MAKLLDTISATVRAAYSIRKLKESYAGFAIQVKRTADAAILSIGFDSNGKLDIAAIAAFETSALMLNKYYDQSGNGYDLPAAGSAQAAISVSSGVLTITGTANTKWSNGTNMPGGAIAAPKIFTVAKPTQVNANNYISDFGSNIYFTAIYFQQFLMYAGSSLFFSEAVANGLQQFSAFFQSGNDTARRNGTNLTAAGNAGDPSYSAGVLTLGGYGGANGYSFAGAIFEWIYVEGAISNTDRDAIEASQYNNLLAPTVTALTAAPNSSSQITVAYAANHIVGAAGWDLDWSATGSSGWTSLLSNVLTASPYIHTGLSPSTAYYYRYRARDAAGNVSGYSTANATTAAYVAPTVAITSPTGGIVGGTVAVTASASSSLGVTSVVFKIGTTTIATDSAAPYAATLNTTGFANGDYSLTATAYDSGGSAVSSAVAIAISNFDPNYIPYNDTGIARNRYYAYAPDFAAITGTHTYQDGGKSFNELSDSPLLRWELVYQFDTRISAHLAQITAMDAFFANKRISRSFIFIAKDGTYLNTFHESFEKSHDGHKSWAQTRRIVLVKYPNETNTDTILTDTGGVILLTDG